MSQNVQKCSRQNETKPDGMSGGTGIRPTPHHLASAQNDPVFTTSEPVSIGEIEDFIDANAEWAVVNHRLQQDIAAGRVKPEVRA